MKHYFIYSLLIISLLVVYSCKEKPLTTGDDNYGVTVQDTIKLDTVAEVMSELDSIRALSNEAYTDAAAEDTTPDKDSNYKKGVLCTPCDIKFLVYLQGKSDYNMQDVKTLLCLDDNDQCIDNAEFTQFYNEMIFKVFQRERHDFIDAELKALLKDRELVEELSAPVQDGFNISLLKELKADAENPKD
jgi:hypothetical protein